MKMACRFWCWFSALELDLDSRSITFSVSTTSFLFWEQICLASMRAALVKSNQIKTHFLVLRHCKIKKKHQNQRNHFKPDTWEPTMIDKKFKRFGKDGRLGCVGGRWGPDWLTDWTMALPHTPGPRLSTFALVGFKRWFSLSVFPNLTFVSFMDST